MYYIYINIITYYITMLKFIIRPLDRIFFKNLLKYNYL